MLLRALRIMRGVCGVALLVSSASLSHGQEAPLDPAQGASNIPVPQEEQPVIRKKRAVTDPYAAAGVDTGGLRLFPTLEIDAIVTSNVRKSTTNAKSDIGVAVKPGLSFASDWSRHSWTGSASGDWQRFNGADDLATLSGSAQSAFRLDILRTTRADFSASYSLNQAGTENSQVPGNAKNPRRDHNFAAAASVTHDFGGLEGTFATGLARSIYEDVALVGGGTEKNADRNYWEPTLSLRGSLGGAGAPLKPFAEIAYAPRFHDQTLDRNGQNRDSQGVTLSAGVAFDQGPLWQGEVAIVDQLRSYADPALKTSNAIGIAGRVTWRPTTITSFDATTSVSLDETATINIAASKTWTAGLNLTHALRDNLSAKAGTSFSIQNTGTSVDHTTTATLGLDWQVNPNMTTGVTYSGTWFTAGSSGGDYNDQRLMTSIILKQ
jgi:hypothetical protein